MKLRLLLLSLSVLGTVAAVAQDTASVTGTVRDSSGGVIVGAEVTITNIDQGLGRTFRSNTSGEYLAAALPPGLYSITVKAPSFAVYEAHEVTLRVAQSARIDVTLRVGQVNSHTLSP